MGKIVRSIGAVIAGFVAASAVMMLIEMVNGHVLYPDLGKMAEGVTDKEVIRAMLASAPVGALLVVIFGWVLGSLAGGFLAAWIGRDAPVLHALILPPPAWFWIPTLLVFLPAACAGARFAPRGNRATA